MKRVLAAAVLLALWAGIKVIGVLDSLSLIEEAYEAEERDYS